MPELVYNLNGILLILITCCLIYGLFYHLGSSYAMELSLASGPVALALLLQVFLLTIPGGNISTYQLLLTVTVLVPSCIWLLPSSRLLKMLNGRCLWLAILFCFTLSLPIFLFIRPVFCSFDPANYYLIGKTFLQGTSIMDYPFVAIDRTTNIFSWFAHPPLLPSMHSYLILFHLESLSPYISAFYSFLLLLLMFRVSKKYATCTTGVLICILLLVTPIFVRTSILGFTAPLRMFFFTATGVVLIDSKKHSDILTGLFVGITMNVHILGLIALPGAVLAYVLVNREVNLQKILKLVGVGLVLGLFWYGWNLWKLGSLDTTLYMAEYFPGYINKYAQFQFQQQGMHSLEAKLLWGASGPFTRISSFGLGFWIGTVLLFIAMASRKVSPLLISVCALTLTYVGFHFIPVRYNISWLSPRYPLTILPLILLGGIAALNSRAWEKILALTILVSGILILGFHNPYFKERDHYSEMQKLVQSNVNDTDKVLVVHSPYFFIYNAEAHGVDSIDPRLSYLYRMYNLKNVTQELERLKFTYLLMPWAPSPFETDSFIRELFMVENLLQPIANTRSFHLYRFRYSNAPIREIQRAKLVEWPTEDKLNFTTYSNNSEGTPPRLWMTRNVVSTFAPKTGGVVAIAPAPLWEKNAGMIDVIDFDSVQIRVRIRKHNQPFTIHPIIALFDENGNRIRLLHPAHFETNSGWTTFHYATGYPHFLTDRIPLSPDCRSISVGLSFFRESGGFSIEGIEVYGYQY